jgi:hypothetical protein
MYVCRALHHSHMAMIGSQAHTPLGCCPPGLRRPEIQAETREPCCSWFQHLYTLPHTAAAMHPPGPGKPGSNRPLASSCCSLWQSSTTRHMTWWQQKVLPLKFNRGIIIMAKQCSPSIPASPFGAFAFVRPDLMHLLEQQVAAFPVNAHGHMCSTQHQPWSHNGAAPDTCTAVVLGLLLPCSLDIPDESKMCHA